MTFPDVTQPTREVSVSGIRLRFAASHMATLGSVLEPLHGHNYVVSCRVEGNLTDDNWVIDFSVLKELLRSQCDLLDHKFLLQMNSDQLSIIFNEELSFYSIRHGDRTYQIPAADIVALSIENSTAELIAEHIAEAVIIKISASNIRNLRKITLEVEEMPGQSGIYTRVLPSDTNHR
ncbi:MAG: 6-carboxytetrahydropterin synthase [Chloroflexota bacterium]|nr:6-carboxytetrahydropterin synthase [Chloroflexota bacterium]